MIQLYVLSNKTILHFLELNALESLYLLSTRRIMDLAHGIKSFEVF